jgi:hypothetical protein
MDNETYQNSGEINLTFEVPVLESKELLEFYKSLEPKYNAMLEFEPKPVKLNKLQLWILRLFKVPTYCLPIKEGGKVIIPILNKGTETAQD